MTVRPPSPRPRSDEAHKLDTVPETDEQDIQEAGDEPGEPVVDSPAAVALARPLILTCLAVAAIAVMIAATVLTLKASRTQVPQATDNDAFEDQATTTAVIEEVNKAVTAVFSVDPAAVQTTQKAAVDVLVGRAVDQYRTLYGPLLQGAPAQGLTLTTVVRSTGETVLNGDRAQVLVLADQSAKSTATGQSEVGPAHLDLIVERHGGHWKIAGIEVL